MSSYLQLQRGWGGTVQEEHMLQNQQYVQLQCTLWHTIHLVLYYNEMIIINNKLRKMNTKTIIK